MCEDFEFCEECYYGVDDVDMFFGYLKEYFMIVVEGILNLN